MAIRGGPFGVEAVTAGRLNVGHEAGEEVIDDGRITRSRFGVLLGWCDLGVVVDEERFHPLAGAHVPGLNALLASIPGCPTSPIHVPAWPTMLESLT